MLLTCPEFHQAGAVLQPLTSKMQATGRIVRPGLVGTHSHSMLAGGLVEMS